MVSIKKNTTFLTNPGLTERWFVHIIKQNTKEHRHLCRPKVQIVNPSSQVNVSRQVKRITWQEVGLGWKVVFEVNAHREKFDLKRVNCCCNSIQVSNQPRVCNEAFSQPAPVNSASSICTLSCS